MDTNREAGNEHRVSIITDTCQYHHVIEDEKDLKVLEGVLKKVKREAKKHIEQISNPSPHDNP